MPGSVIIDSWRSLSEIPDTMNDTITPRRYLPTTSREWTRASMVADCAARALPVESHERGGRGQGN